MKRIGYILLTGVTILLVGCRNDAVEPSFWLGADISGTTELEQHDVQFYNHAGEVRENTALMKELGLNAIRLRVWVNPQNFEFRQDEQGQWIHDETGEWIGFPTSIEEGHVAWCSPEDVLAMALRAKALDMPVMIDFHYSDWWADPHKQNIPQAWADMNFEQMCDAAMEHTTYTLSLLKEHDIDVRWVQIGNETTHGFLWPVARAEEHMDHYAAITDSCYAAAKAIYPETQCIVHIDCGSDMRRYRFILDGLRQFGTRYDMVGMSMYPYWDAREHLTDNEDETLSRVIANIDSIYHDYGRETMITEFGYLSSQPEAGYAYLLKSIRMLRDSTNGHCKGLFYWAPEAEGSYPLGAFQNHRPTCIMNAFKDSQHL